MTISQFTPLAGADDQDVVINSATYPVTGTVLRFETQLNLYVRRALNAGAYEVRHALLRFDTSSIPDGNELASANLQIYVTAAEGVNALAVTVGYYAWDGVSDSDYTNGVRNNANAGVAISSLTTNAVNTFRS